VKSELIAYLSWCQLREIAGELVDLQLNRQEAGGRRAELSKHARTGTYDHSLRRVLIDQLAQCGHCAPRKVFIELDEVPAAMIVECVLHPAAGATRAPAVSCARRLRAVSGPSTAGARTRSSCACRPESA
jgi:hypothetical protein